MDITKINENRIQESQVQQSGDAAKTQKSEKVQSEKIRESSGTQKASKKEKVEWSGDAIAFEEGLNAAKQADPVRAEKVAELKAAIKSGNYKADAQKIADSMIQKSLEDGLLTRKGS